MIGLIIIAVAWLLAIGAAVTAALIEWSPKPRLAPADEVRHALDGQAVLEDSRRDAQAVLDGAQPRVNARLQVQDADEGRAASEVEVFADIEGVQVPVHGDDELVEADTQARRKLLTEVGVLAPEGVDLHAGRGLAAPHAPATAPLASALSGPGGAEKPPAGVP